MANTATNASCTERPTLTDIDSELLRNILAQEAKYFQQASNAVRGSDKPLDPTAEQGSSLLVKIATSLLRYKHCVCYLIDNSQSPPLWFVCVFSKNE